MPSLKMFSTRKNVMKRATPKRYSDIMIQYCIKWRKMMKNNRAVTTEYSFYKFTFELRYK